MGGMGEVWRGEHELLPRPAAIKLIRPDRLHTSSALEVDAMLRRFEREVRATVTLRSPHTVEIYDFGITDDQVFYYVMELLDGLDLSNLVKRFGPLPEARVAYLLQQVCESLSEAHAQGLVHRDIKPANIYTCRLGNRFDYIKVLDFGLVAAIDPGNESTALVAEAGVAGTPAYMAPEMLQGEKFIDGRADIYALGCVGYWLLTGQLVFEGDNVVDIARGHLTGAVVPPSARCGRRLDRALEDAVVSCLAKDPAHRPATASDLSDQLTTATATRVWMNEQAREWWQSNLAP